MVLINTYKQKLFYISITVFLFTSCGKIKTPFYPEKYIDYLKDRLLTDEELWTEEDPNAPTEKSEWIHWIEENNIPIRSLFCDDFTDLQFFKPLLENRRLVQLGESGHGVAQFNQAKVRLIKFLHQECGFNVMAFEGSIFGCFYTNENMTSMTPIDMMRHSIYPVWYTWEVEPLFQYIKDSYQTNTPLVLAGFDVQQYTKSITERPHFLRNVISKINPDSAEAVYQLDSLLISMRIANTYGYWDYLADNEEYLVKRYENIVQFMDQNMNELKQAFLDNPGIPLISRQAAWSMIAYIHEIAAWKVEDEVSSFEFRDKGMADNIDFLLDELYPDSKIIVWAHNTHIRHNNIDVMFLEPQCKSMGAWVSQRHRSELYTIGFYMYRGQAATNIRDIYDIEHASYGSLESIFYTVRKRYCFVDLLNQSPKTGNPWMFERILAKRWGYTDLKMVLKDQYDGILFIDTVTPPDYIPSEYFKSDVPG